ncbi:hypothetical protein BH24CHL6_BH24CHL6_14890 [soil metagenome]
MKLAERNRDALLIIFAVTGGAWAWTLQLWLSWILGEPLCFAQAGEFTLAGLGSRALWVGIGIGTGALAVAALLASYRLWRRAGGERPLEEPSGSGARRFLAYTGLVLNLLFLATIALGTTSPLWLAPCI